MSKVARIELYHVAVPLPAPFYPAWIPGLPMTENRFDLIRVVTDDGVDGWSAGPRMSRERRGLGDVLGPYLLGEEATDIDLIQQRIREIGYLGWRNAWIEPAFWDIKGKLAGKPVCELLGAKPRRIQLYASTGQVRGPDERIAEAEARLAEGFKAIKLRVHAFDEKDDEEQVIKVAAAMGDRMEIGVDANQGWRVTAVGDAPLWDLARARRFAKVCADAGVAWLEEPLPMDAYEDQATLTAESAVPIAGGEIHTGGLAELRLMIERGCYRIYQPDAIFTGGIAQTIKIARLCRRHGALYTPHTWTNGIGFAVNLHLAAAGGFADEKKLEYPLDFPGWVPEGRDGVLAEPFMHQKGEIDVPEKPGLGFEIDRRALRRYGKCFSVMDRIRLVWFGLRDRGFKVAKEVDAAKKARRQKTQPPS